MLRLGCLLTVLVATLIATPAAGAEVLPYGALEPLAGADCIGAQCESLDPSFNAAFHEMAFSPDGRHAYTVTGSEVRGLHRDLRTGALSRNTDIGGCFHGEGAGDCSDAMGIRDTTGVVVSPDGKHVYVASRAFGTVYAWLAIFSRNAHDGTLRQVGCLASSYSGDECPQSWLDMAAPRDIEISPDGRHLYVPSESGGSGFRREFSIFVRDAETGLLDEAGCVAGTVASGRTDPNTLHPICQIFPALGETRPQHVEISDDGTQAYLSTWDAVVVAKRDAETGRLIGIADPGGCVNQSGTYPLPDDREGACTLLRGFGGGAHPDIETSPDGRSVYVRGQYGIAITRRDPITGALEQPEGAAGCIAVNQADGCALARGYFGSDADLKVSPDGRSLYNTFRDSSTDGINVYERDVTTGALTAPAGQDGCAMASAEDAAAHDCHRRKAVGHRLLAIPPDSRNVYTNGVTGPYCNGSACFEDLGIAQFVRAQSAVEVRGRTLLHSDLTGYSQSVELNRGTNLVRIRDNAGTILHGHGCRRVSAIVVECSTTGLTALDSQLGAGDDRLTLAATLTSVIVGEAGVDRITGGPLRDVVDGGDDDDKLFASPGNDVMRGGDGTDLASYQARRTPVKVTLDRTANDGADGGAEGDNVTLVERVLGGSSADTLIGSPEAEELSGGGGNDLLDGKLGADSLFGGGGSDTASYASRGVAVNVTLNSVRNDGQAGENDFVRGSDVENVIGGAAGDTITGSRLANALFGGGGPDQLLARDGTTTADTLNCGGGRDAFQVDAADLFAAGAGCETALP